MNSVTTAPPCTCTCRNGKAAHKTTGNNHSLNADEAGDVTAGQVKETGRSYTATADPDADGSAEAEDATGGQGNAAAKGMGNASSDEENHVKLDHGSSSTIRSIASKARAGLARLASSAMRLISDAIISTKLRLSPARAAMAALTFLALRHTADDPRRVVWAFSGIAISYLTLWTICLTSAIRARDVLISVSYVALVADVSATHLCSAAGVLVILLDAAYVAGLFGYALAEYRQRKGLELAAISLHSRIKEGEELEDDRDAVVIAMATFHSAAASVACAGAASWVVYYYVADADAHWVIVVLSLLVDFSLFCWMALVAAHLLRGALLADVYLAIIYWGPVLLLVPDLLISYMFGNAVGVLVHPLGVMGMAGLLGYNLGLYARYKQLLLEDGNGKNNKKLTLL